MPKLEYEDGSIESCFVEVKLNARHIVVGSCYRPPNTDSKQFIKLPQTTAFKGSANKKVNTDRHGS